MILIRCNMLATQGTISLTFVHLRKDGTLQNSPQTMRIVDIDPRHFHFVFERSCNTHTHTHTHTNNNESNQCPSRAGQRGSASRNARDAKCSLKPNGATLASLWNPLSLVDETRLRHAARLRRGAGASIAVANGSRNRPGSQDGLADHLHLEQVRAPRAAER